VSPLRTQPAIRRETSISNWSPASWPAVSLRILKLSIPINKSAPFRPLRAQPTSACWQTVAEEATVGQLGQSIVIGEVLDLLFRRLALGDVDQRADVVGCLATAAPDRHDVEPCRKNLAAFAPIPDFSLPGSLAADAFPYRLIKGCVMLTRPQQARRPPHDVFGRIASDFGKGSVDP